MNKQFNNEGKVSLWPPKSGSDKAPALSGPVFAHRDIKKGEEVSLSLWHNQSTNPNAPTMTGKLGDKYVKPVKIVKIAGDGDAPRGGGGGRGPAPEEMNDDIPFVSNGGDY